MKRLLFLAFLLPSLAFAKEQAVTGDFDKEDTVVINKNFRKNSQEISALDVRTRALEAEYFSKVLAKVTFSGGTPSLAYSVGVSSVTDVSLGNTRINFSTPFQSNKFYVFAIPQDNSAQGTCSYDEATDSVNSVDIICRIATTNGVTDLNFFVVVIGKQ